MKQMANSRIDGSDRLQKRVNQLETALKQLIEEHKVFQINEDLQRYEALLNNRNEPNKKERFHFQ